MQDLEKASTLKRYETEIQSSIDSYKTTYYEKIITSEQLQLILKPKSFDLITYYSISIVNSFIKYYENQIDQINNLKREDAKERRMKKIEEVLEQTIEELYKNCRSSANYDTTLKQLQDFKANLHEPQNLKNLSTQENVISFENEKNLPVKRRDITKDSNGFILNPKQQFKLTLLNCDEQIAKEVILLLNNEDLYDYKKRDQLVSLFATYNLTIKEIEEYKNKYQPIYKNELTSLINKSSEWQTAGEKDREEITKELKEMALESIFERADCNLEVLFEDEPSDITIDDELIKDFGYNNIKTYLQFSNKSNKVYVISKDNYNRDRFEELVNLKLAIRGTQIPIEEILMTLTLKNLNEVYKDTSKKFTRKNKAIEFILNQPDYEEKLSDLIAFRELFKLQDLPEKYSGINLNEITKTWRYTNVIVDLLLKTYNNSKYYNEHDELSDYIKSYKIECCNSPENTCPKAKEFINKNYTKSKLPNLPFHIGCNCTIKAIYKE